MSSKDAPKKRRSLATLLRAARNTHAVAVRTTLEEAGFEDLPRDGVFALSAIGEPDFSPAGLSGWLGISKQAVSQLMDTLVLRGYLEREMDTEDRRRMKFTLTSRGQSVTAASRETVARIEKRLISKVGAAHVEHTRETLTALADLAAEWFQDAPRSISK